MKTTNTYVGIITDIARLSQSKNGNPRYSFVVRTEQGQRYHVRTAPDSMLANDVYNLHRKQHKAAFKVGLHYGKYTLFDVDCDPEPAPNSDKYIDHQFRRLGDTNYMPTAMVQLTCPGGHTNWMNVSAYQVERIKAVLKGPKEQPRVERDERDERTIKVFY